MKSKHFITLLCIASFLLLSCCDKSTVLLSILPSIDNNQSDVLITANIHTSDNVAPDVELSDWKQIYYNYFNNAYSLSSLEFTESLHLIDLNFDEIPEILFGHEIGSGWINKYLFIDNDNVSDGEFRYIIDNIELCSDEDGKVVWLCSSYLLGPDFYEATTFELSFADNYLYEKIIFYQYEWMEYDDEKWCYTYSFDDIDNTVTADEEEIFILYEELISRYVVIPYHVLTISLDSDASNLDALYNGIDKW